MDLGPDEIRRLRGKRSRPRFAALLGVSPNTVYRWELPAGSPHHLRPSSGAVEALLRVAGAEEEAAPAPATAFEPGPALRAAWEAVQGARYEEAQRLLGGATDDPLAAALLARARLLGAGQAEGALATLAPWIDPASREVLPLQVRAPLTLWLGAALGWCDGASHDRARSLALLHAARSEFSRLDDGAGLFWAELCIGLLHFNLIELDEARRHLGASLTQHLGNESGAIAIWRHEAAGHLARLEGDFRRSALEHGKALHVAGRLADAYGTARALSYICERRVEAGDPVREAIAAGEEALGLFAALGDPLEHAQVSLLRGLGECWLGTGHFDEIRTVLGGAVARLEAAGASPYTVREILGRSAFRQGLLAEAREHLAAIRSFGGSMGRHFGLALADQLEAEILTAEGAPHAAAQAWTRARGSADLIGSIGLGGDAEIGRTEALLAAADLEGARGALAAAERTLAQVRSPYLHARLDRARARLLHAEGRHAAARAQLALARDALERCGDPFEARRSDELLASWPEAAEDGATSLPGTTVERIAAASSGGAAQVLAELAASLSEALPGAGVGIFNLAGESLAHAGKVAVQPPLGGVPFGDRLGHRYQLGIEGAPPPVWLRSLLAVAELALEAAQLREGASVAPRPVGADDPFAAIVSGSGAMRELLERIRKLRTSSVSVLVQGESGVGKELIARAIHEVSGRTGKLVSVNCAAVPAPIFEAQLFGHKRGTFTGADRDAPGFVRTAEGGTLFLDEVGELPMALQPKLLRFLQEGEIHPVGAEAPIRVDVRVISATNRNLEELVRQGRFREDLYYRIHVVPILVPPLRERLEDVPLLASHFLRQLCGPAAPRIAEDALAALIHHPWPGNVRQLRNELERIVALHGVPEVIGREMLTPQLLGA